MNQISIDEIGVGKGRGTLNSRGNKASGRFFVGLLLCFLIGTITFALVSCNRTQKALFNRLLQVEGSGYEGEDVSRQTIAELKAAIAQLEDEIDRTVDAGERVGVYYKLVAMRYLDQEMYGLAVGFFEKALTISPRNHYLAYMAGLSTAALAGSKIDPVEREALFTEAEAYYQYAIQLSARYVDALYALAVLYVFELGRPDEAEPLLERILQREEMNFSAMFLLARLYAGGGRIDDAVSLYDKIDRKSPSSEQRDQAATNKRILLEGGE